MMPSGQTGWDDREAPGVVGNRNPFDDSFRDCGGGSPRTLRAKTFGSRRAGAFRLGGGRQGGRCGRPSAPHRPSDVLRLLGKRAPRHDITTVAHFLVGQGPQGRAGTCLAVHRLGIIRRCPFAEALRCANPLPWAPLPMSSGLQIKCAGEPSPMPFWRERTRQDPSGVLELGPVL